MTDPAYVLIITGPTERRFGIHLEPTPDRVESSRTRGPVVMDVDAGTELGEAGATWQPIMVDIDGEQHVLFAGTADFAEQKFTAIDGHLYRVCREDAPRRVGVWMSFPELFTPGRVVAVTGLAADQRELFRLTSPPLDADRLRPVFGPAWTRFAPLDE